MTVNKEAKDELIKLFEVGLSRAGSMLNSIAVSHLDLEIAGIEILSPQELEEKLTQRFGTIKITVMELVFTGEFEGNVRLIFPQHSAAFLIEKMSSEERKNLEGSELKKGIICEVGNILFNGIMGVISTVMEYSITYMVPKYQEGRITQFFVSPNSSCYSTALLTKIQVDKGKDLLFCFLIDSLDSIIEKSQNLERYFGNG